MNVRCRQCGNGRGGEEGSGNFTLFQTAVVAAELHQYAPGGPVQEVAEQVDTGRKRWIICADCGHTWATQQDLGLWVA